MAFNSTLVMTNGTATVTLSGELDAASAPQFKAEVERAAAQQPKRLVLMMAGLNYMASAGLRVLVFAKQKMGTGVDIYMVGTQESVLETITLTGFQNSVILLDKYDAAKIERQ